VSEELGPPAVELASGSSVGRKRSLPVVGVATVIVGVAGYLIIYIAFRSLGAAGYAQFAVFWSALYLVAGAMFGVQQEATRAVRTAGKERHDRATRAIWQGLAIGTAIAVAIIGSAPWWAASLFGENSTLFVALLAAGALLYAGHSAMAGSMAGLDLWGRYSLLLITESLVRLGAVLLATAIGMGIVWLAVAATIAMGTWLAYFLFAGFRNASLHRLDVTLPQALGHSAQSVLAAVASAILVTGFPVILRATAGSVDPAILGVVILIVTLTRAPIMMPLNAFLGMIIAAFVDSRDSGLRTVLRPMALVAIGGVVLSACAVVVGAPILTWIFGAEASAPPWFIGGATLGAALIGVLSIGGTATLARSKHLGYAIGWLVAAAIACAVLYIPVEIYARVVLALIIGPIVGVAIHVGVLASAQRSQTKARLAQSDSRYHES
jgi:O-antigen/teichoic acid export membrane protein